MDAIILAGGLGTRLKHVVPNLPKPLAPINGIPFLDILLNQIATYDKIKRVIFATGYKSDLISSHFSQKNYPFSLTFSKEETPLGTGGAVKLAHKHVQSSQYYVFNGDSYLDIDFEMFIQNHHAALTIACRHVDNVSRYGEIELDAHHKILSFKEKSTQDKPGWINGGIYLMNKELKFPQKDNFSLENDFFPTLIHNIEVFGYPVHGKFIDIGTENSYKLAQEVLT